jgi:putative peptidoglycan lipid II flippase
MMATPDQPPASVPVRRLRVTLWLVALAGCSSLLGLLRDQCIARFFGSSAQTDAFLVAWTVPETAMPLLMEGAAALLLVPVFARALTGDGSIQRVVRATFASFCLALLGLTAAVAAAAPVLVHVFAPGLADPALAVRCLRMSATTVLSLGIAGYLMSALRASGKYVLTMTVYSGFNIGVLAMVLLLRRSQGVYAAALGLAVGGCLTVAVQAGPFLRRSSLRHLRWISARTATLALAGILPVAMYTFGRQAQVYVERYYGSGLHPGAISALSYAEKIAQIPVQAATMLAVVSFPLLAKQAAAGRAGELRRAAERDLRMVAFLILPAVGMLVALAPQIVSVLFQRGAFGEDQVRVTATALRVYSLGLPGQTVLVVTVVCLSSLAPAGWSLARAALAGLVLTVLADALLVHPLGIAGLALGNAIGVTVTAAAAIAALWRRMPRLAVLRLAGAVVRGAVAAATAGAAGHGIGGLPLSPTAAVALGSVVVMACYLTVASLLGLGEARQTRSLLRGAVSAGVAVATGRRRKTPPAALSTNRSIEEVGRRAS